jgi:hypothetical protein
MTVWKARIQDPTDINIISMPNYKEWRQRSRSFASLAIFDSAGRGYNLTGIAEPEQVSGVRGDGEFLLRRASACRRFSAARSGPRKRIPARIASSS